MFFRFQRVKQNREFEYQMTKTQRTLTTNRLVYLPSPVSLSHETGKHELMETEWELTYILVQPRSVSRNAVSLPG